MGCALSIKMSKRALQCFINSSRELNIFEPPSNATFIVMFTQDKFKTWTIIQGQNGPNGRQITKENGSVVSVPKGYRKQSITKEWLSNTFCNKPINDDKLANLGAISCKEWMMQASTKTMRLNDILVAGWYGCDMSGRVEVFLRCPIDERMLRFDGLEQ
jgi:hypothetical protein